MCWLPTRGRGAAAGAGLCRADGMAQRPPAEPAPGPAAPGDDSARRRCWRRCRATREAAARVRGRRGPAGLARGERQVLLRPPRGRAAGAAASTGAVRGRGGREVLVHFPEARGAGAVCRRERGGLVGDPGAAGAGRAADARWAAGCTPCIRRCRPTWQPMAPEGGGRVRGRACRRRAGVAERLCRLRGMACSRSGLVQRRWHWRFERQRRTMGRLLAFALSEGRYAEAQAIFCSRSMRSGTRGAGEEAQGWVDRLRRLWRAPAARHPTWAAGRSSMVFAAGSEANRAIGPGDLAGAEGAYQDIVGSWNSSGGQRAGITSGAYHNVGVAAGPGRLAGGEAWYRKAREIREAIGDRPAWP